MTALRTRSGFNPLLVNWGGPDETRTDRCSYCGDRFPEDEGFVPLIMWNDDGWCAEFCDHCQATWFGVQSFPEPADDPHEATFGDEEAMPDLGPCCMCGGARAQTIVMLDRRAAVPGHGWGCVECGLPSDGAVAVLCDPCVDRYAGAPAALAQCCRGYPASDGRIAIAELPLEPFGHDLSKHPETR